MLSSRPKCREPSGSRPTLSGPWCMRTSHLWAEEPSGKVQSSGRLHPVTASLSSDRREPVHVDVAAASADALAQVEAAQKSLTEAVAAARSAGWSWAQVGEVLGTSRQAVWERFHRRL